MTPLRFDELVTLACTAWLVLVLLGALAGVVLP